MRDWQELHQEAVVADLHNHPMLKATLFRRDMGKSTFGGLSKVCKLAFWPPAVRSNFPKMIEGGLDLSLSTVYIPEQGWFDDLPILKAIKWLNRAAWKNYVAPPYFDSTIRSIDLLEEQVANYNTATANLGAVGEPRRDIIVARTRKELNKGLRVGSLCLVHAVEGAHSLHGSVTGKPDAEMVETLDGGSATDEVLANLENLWDRGVAYLTLAHFYPNMCVYPCFPYPEYAFTFTKWKGLMDKWDHTKGLTDTGRAVVERMFELGMIVDITHCTPAARSEIYRLAEKHKVKAGVIASHNGVAALNPDPYCLEDWEIRWIADHGGVIGVIFMNYWLYPTEQHLGMKYVLKTISHLHDVGGENVIGIGTDFDGFTDPPDDLEDMTRLPRLTRELVTPYSSPRRRRYSDSAVKKILGGNALRVLREGWKKD